MLLLKPLKLQGGFPAVEVRAPNLVAVGCKVLHDARRLRATVAIAARVLKETRADGMFLA